MEMLELNNAANQAAITGNGAFNIAQHQQIIAGQQAQAQQLSNNPINLGPGHLYRTHQQPQPQHQQQPPQHPLRYMSNPKVSKHRELPVDVPDSFVGIAKQSPRYPPPKPHRQVSPSMPKNSVTTFNNTPSTMPYSPTNTTATYAQQSVVPPIAQSAATTIVAHNNSLRGSMKLKQLEKSRNGNSNYTHGQLQPAINQAFELNEDDAILHSVNNNGNHVGPNTHSTNRAQVNSDPEDSKMKQLEQTIPDLGPIYNRLQKNLNGEFADVTGDAKLVKLLSIYNTIIRSHNKQFKIPSLISRYATTVNSQGAEEPLNYKLCDLLQSVIDLLRDERMTNDSAELLSILCRHEVEGVCSAFDRIAQSFEFAKSSRPSSPVNQTPPTLNRVPDNGVVSTHHMYPLKQQQQQQQLLGNHQMQQSHQMNDYEYATDQVHMDIDNGLYQDGMQPLTDIDLSGGGGTCIKTVRVEKTLHQPLGATIKNGDDGRVVIGRIVYGGAAHKSGLFHEDDEIMEVNGVKMRGKNVNEVVALLEGMNGPLTFTLVTRNYTAISQRNYQEKFVVRTFFDYDAENDDFIPCKELGLSFEKGEILIIIDRSDPKWWQAHKEGDDEWKLAGLIPSIDCLKQRSKVTSQDDITDIYMKQQQEKRTLVSMLFNCPKGSSSRRRNKGSSIPFKPDEIPYYEVLQRSTITELDPFSQLEMTCHMAPTEGLTGEE